MSDNELLTPALEDCEWFKRGCTLQELIFPKKVIFLNQTSEAIGHQDYMEPQNLEGFGSTQDISSIVSDIIGISEEDLAYCLQGIFDVFMPLVYGEGQQ